MTDTIFSLANTTALLAWAALILLPRWLWLLRALRWGVIGAFCLIYTGLVSVWFFQVPGGGYGSLAAVQALFATPQIALAGWLHYLAFDLLVGLWIAQACDARQIGRGVQAPLLAVTFMFGPVGWLFYLFLNIATQTPENTSEGRA